MFCVPQSDAHDCGLGFAMHISMLSCFCVCAVYVYVYVLVIPTCTCSFRIVFCTTTLWSQQRQQNIMRGQ